ncbi:MAG: PAS domain S-box protein [Anaeromyxobacteraceae bacterium]
MPVELARLLLLPLVSVAGTGAFCLWRARRPRGRPLGANASATATLLDRLEEASRFVNDAVLIAGPGQDLLFANDRAVSMLGYARDELLRMNVRELRDPATLGDFDARVREQLEAGAARFETRFRRKDDVSLAVEVSIRVFQLEGRPYFQATIRDVTERRRLEEALRASEERLRAIIMTEPECVKVIAPDGKLVEMNPSGLGMLEAESLAHAQATPLVDFVDPEDRPAFVGLLDTVMSGGSGRLHFGVTGLRGAHRTLETNAVPLRDADGRITGLLGVTRDITERMRAEAALRRSEERFRELIEKSSDLLLVLDADGRVTFASPSSEGALGRAPGELQGRRLAELLVPEDQPQAAAALARLRDDRGGTMSLVARAARSDGSWRLLEMVGRDLLDVPAVMGLVINARDVTDQRRLEEQLAQAQRLESIGRLAGGIAHDFNNLLVAILCNVEFLEEGLRSGHARVEDLQDIRTAGERARDLTAQLLAVARRQVIAPRRLDVGRLVREAEKLLSRVMGEDVAMEVILGDGLWPIQGDAGQLQQVILNLAVNARDAMPKGGRFTLEAANVELSDRLAASLPGATAGPHVLLRFSDTGEGMTDRVKAHVFEPFFTTKPTGRGTGLGLATVYGIVKQSAGFIEWESELGVGTTFRIYLPRANPDAAEDVPALASPTSRGTETILVVEDEQAVRDVAVRSLSGAGYKVLAAAGGRQALDLLACLDQPLHLLLTDVVMPDVSGKEVAGAANRLRPAPRVLYMSGYANDAIAHHGVLEPGVELLAKPFTPSGLLARVRAVLDLA